MAKVMFYGTGRRKNAIARVYLVPGEGKVTINDRPVDVYFGRRTLEMIVRQPMELTGASARFDVRARVLGGGNTGQAGAIKMGIARALILADRGERYLDTIYSDEWVRSHFGDVSTRWEELAGKAASTPLGTETSSHCQPVSADALKSETSKLEFV